VWAAGWVAGVAAVWAWSCAQADGASGGGGTAIVADIAINSANVLRPIESNPLNMSHLVAGGYAR
jgi:hypothetical protein